MVATNFMHVHTLEVSCHILVPLVAEKYFASHRIGAGQIFGTISATIVFSSHVMADRQIRSYSRRRQPKAGLSFDTTPDPS